jgi:hypothetical protein
MKDEEIVARGRGVKRAQMGNIRNAGNTLFQKLEGKKVTWKDLDLGKIIILKCILKTV